MPKWRLPEVAMMGILQTVSAPEFLVSLLLILMYQGSLFNLFGTEELEYDRFSWISNLRTYDLVNPKTFYGYLLLYLLVSAVSFAILCGVSPTFIRGWMVLNHAGDQAGDVSDVPYELFLAAAYMGVTQSLPATTKAGLLQRRIFHHLIGVPNKVLIISDNISNAINASYKSRDEKIEYIKKLCSSAEFSRIDDDADIPFLKKTSAFYRFWIRMMRSKTRMVGPTAKQNGR